MATIKINKTKNYTVMSNYHLRDKNLSLKAKGLMSLMLSLPDDWGYSIEGLSKIVLDGVTAVRSALKELEELNYLRRKKITDNKGKILDWQYDLYENPLVENPLVENPLVENPLVENPLVENLTQINTNITNKEEINKDKYKVSKKDNETFDDIINEMCQNEKLKETIYEFIKMRKLIKKPLTNRALRNIIKRVKTLSNGNGSIAIQILDQSIDYCWQDVFPLKENSLKPNKKTNCIQREYTKNELSPLYASLDEEI